MVRAALGLVASRIALLVSLLALVFLLIELLPGDAASSTVDRGSSAVDVARHRAELGLDDPVLIRFLRWMLALPTGDFGVTARGEPVSAVIGRYLPNTLLLGGLALIVTLIAAIALGCLAASRPGRLADRLIGTGSTTVLALPEFVVASVLVLVLALWAGLLPAVTSTTFDGRIASPQALVVPVLALAIPQIGWNTRIVRAALADESRAPHVEAAVLDGLPTRGVLLHHVLPGALPTIAVGAATSAGMLLGGAVVVETILNYPGIGTVLAEAVRDRDTPLVAAVVATTGLVILTVLVAADVVRAWASGRRP